MTQWLQVHPGEEKELAVVDQTSYYHTHAGLTTSGQYYLNPAGYYADQACRWGDQSKPLGNWAPAVVGLSVAKDGIGYFGLSNNAPTQTKALLGYTVTIKGGDFECKYSNHTIAYNGQTWDAFDPHTAGCTVGVRPESSAVYELTPN
jgi:SUN family beta-glucosidase